MRIHEIDARFQLRRHTKSDVPEEKTQAEAKSKRNLLKTHARRGRKRLRILLDSPTHRS
jgi:hypothetical protein